MPRAGSHGCKTRQAKAQSTKVKQRLLQVDLLCICSWNRGVVSCPIQAVTEVLPVDMRTSPILAFFRLL